MRGVGSAPKSNTFFSNSILKKPFCHSERSRGIPWRYLSAILRDPSTALRGARDYDNNSEAICEICGYKSGMKIRSSLILLLSMWIAPLVLAQQTPQSLADAELPSLVGIYKEL